MAVRSGTWVPSRDEVSFRIVAALFPADVLLAAGVLLASYDDPAEEGADAAPRAMLPQQATAAVP